MSFPMVYPFNDDVSLITRFPSHLQDIFSDTDRVNMSVRLQSGVTTVLLGILFYYGFSDAGFLWFETVPNPDDPCVITVIE